MPTPETLLLCGDSADVLRTLPDASIDAVVCDPPYGLSAEPDAAEVLRHWLAGDNYTHRAAGGFMGKTWDSFVPGPKLWAEVLRVLKPGGHAVVFAGTRTQDLMGMSLRLAGFEIRDGLAWLYGSGFPKSLSVSKASLPKVEERYGSAQCGCLDAGDGCASRDDAGCSDREAVRLRRTERDPTTEQVAGSQLSVDAGKSDDNLRKLRENGRADGAGHRQATETVLLGGLCGGSPKAPGSGVVALRSGLEKPQSRNTSQGQGLQVVRYDAGGERRGTARSSSQAVSVRGDEPSDKPNRALQIVSPSYRSDHREGASLDPDRRHLRRVVADDCSGRGPAVACVCSWCGLPDGEWLESLSGLGTALKPAHEPAILARKPLAAKTVVGNVLALGTGALNVNACRVSATPEDIAIQRARTGGAMGAEKQAEIYGKGYLRTPAGNDLGRWPANVLHDNSPEVIAAFPQSKDGIAGKRSGVGSIGPVAKGYDDVWGGYGGEGSAARFFAACPPEAADRFMYCAKASKAERGPDCTHPTVKPVAVMRWLCRLVTPPGGTVLDPFMGSGTTGIAAAAEGFGFVGIEREPEYHALAHTRIARAAGTLAPELPLAA